MTPLAAWCSAGLAGWPRSGEAVNAEGWRFEVTAVDGRRVSQVRARRSGPEAPPLTNR